MTPRTKQAGVDIPITIADYGSSDGNSLLEILAETSIIVRKIFSNRDINVVFIDKSENAFKSLMKNISYYKQKQTVVTTDGNNFIQENGGNIYFSGICEDFYKQCLPHGVVSLALCIEICTSGRVRLGTVFTDEVQGIACWWLSDYICDSS